MRMQVIQKLGAVILLLVFGCSSTPTVELRTGTSACEGRPDLMGLSIYVFHAEANTRFSFDADGLTKTPVVDDATLARIPRNDPGLNFLTSLQKAFPKEPSRLPTGELLGFPAASSPDGRKWAAAIISGTDKRTTELVIRNQTDFHRKRNLDGFDLGTLVWSPGSTLLAAIERRSTTSSKSIRDVLSPHPVPYSDIVLTIHRSSGDVLCQAVLVHGVRYASVRAEWLSPKPPKE
jgi:hypothetical protein